ncbi:MAG: TlpA family protein disulfide reductase [Terriglobales bacterium]
MAFRVLPAALARRLSLRLGVVAGLMTLDLLLVAASLLALRQNVELRRAVADDALLLTPSTGSLEPPLEGEDWLGNPQRIAYQGDRRPTLVYTFTKECPHCQENWRVMRIVQAMAPSRLRIVYIDTGDQFAPKYLAENGIAKSVLLTQLSSTALAYNARVVPQLVLLDRNGRVQWAHLGGLAPSDISRALSLIEHDQIK